MDKVFWCFGFLSIMSLVLGKTCPPQAAILPCRCLLKQTDIQVWCSHSDLLSVIHGLQALRSIILEPIDELILENNYLPSLPGRVFAQMKILRLMLRYNGLSRVSSDWLSGLEGHLMELYIVEPDLRSIPDDSFTSLNNLQALTIQTNLMKRFPFISGLQSLRYIQLESAALSELRPRNFKKLPRLEILHVTQSPQLVRLEEGLLHDLPKLALLNISYCGINWIHHAALTRLPSLRELALVGNKIVDVRMIGHAVKHLQQLQLLRLDSNHIEVIPEAAFVGMSSLRQLFLPHNRVRELQYGAFHQVPRLKTLNLNHNQVRKVHPESFLQQSGTGVEEIVLVSNNISDISELRSLLDALPRLLLLDISHNNLKIIPFGALRGHATLESLYLDYNKISIIDNEAFMAMPALRELRLKNNSLSDMVDGPLWNLPALKGLDLSGNFYRKLEAVFLQNLPSLRRVDLSSNQINFIEPAAFRYSPRLEHVNLSYNVLREIHPVTFRSLVNLYELDISYNFLIEFVPNLPHGLEYLHLSHNQISTLPPPRSEGLNLPSLKMLDVAYNKLNNIPRKALKSVQQLKRLYLRHNALRRLEDGSLSGLSRLEILDLADNKLVQIERHALSELVELKDLNLRSNRLELLFPEMLANTPRLRRINLSYNNIAELLPGVLDKATKLLIVDLSNNFLVQIPKHLQALTMLKILDLSSNRLKTLENLRGLTSIEELYIRENFIQELPTGIFDGLEFLRVLNLANNELEVVNNNAIRSLRSLKMLKLPQNKLSELPDFAFSNLPSLDTVELQENHLTLISKDAFHHVPHVLMLNLSHNDFETLDRTALRGLKSLEMLDLSYNKLTRVAKQHFEKMEFLVELRLNENQICGVDGAPFNEMPRLRVLNLSDNRLVVLPGNVLNKIRANLAELQLNGNPLSCSCSLIWLQVWLRESSSLGPKCSDGRHLRDVELAHNCPSNATVEMMEHCGSYDAGEAAPAWMRLKANITSKNKNFIAPSPEESDYFYDEYVDYAFNETLEAGNSTTSAHYISGDTPTIYAAPQNTSKDFPKEITNSPSNSGFTFFGVPLPSLNLWGKSKNGSLKSLHTVGAPAVATRKMAIVNSPRTGSRAGAGLPTSPQVETGGFVPLLPGSGGFKPIRPAHYMTTMPTSPVVSETHNVGTTIDVDLSHDRGKVTTTPTIESTTTAVTEKTTVLDYSVEELSEELTTELLVAETIESTTVILSTEAETTTSDYQTTLPAKSQKGVGTPLSALLAPGGQQFEYRGKSTITKVQSPNVPAVSDILEPAAQLREPKTARTQFPIESASDDTSWYFANYNKTNLEPYVSGRVQSTTCRAAPLEVVCSFYPIVVISLLLSRFNG